MQNYYQNQRGSNKQHQKQTQINTKNILYIGELPPDMDEYELNQFLLSKDKKFIIDSLTVKKTRENKSFAYVKFSCQFEGKHFLIKITKLKRHVNCYICVRLETI